MKSEIEKEKISAFIPFVCFEEISGVLSLLIRLENVPIRDCTYIVRIYPLTSIATSPFTELPKTFFEMTNNELKYTRLQVRIHLKPRKIENAVCRGWSISRIAEIFTFVCAYKANIFANFMKFYSLSSKTQRNKSILHFKLDNIFNVILQFEILFIKFKNITFIERGKSSLLLLFIYFYSTFSFLIKTIRNVLIRGRIFKKISNILKIKKFYLTWLCS